VFGGRREETGCSRIRRDRSPSQSRRQAINWGPNPERLGLVGIGTVSAPVPAAALAAHFSPMPRIAPPPVGSVSPGADKADHAFSERSPRPSDCIMRLHLWVEGNGVLHELPSGRSAIRVGITLPVHSSYEVTAPRRSCLAEHVQCPRP